MPDPISWQGALPFYAVAFFAGYLLGSIPFGLLLTRMAGLGDVRDIGSGNIGATNVLRTGSRKLAVATLLLDALKGTAAVLLFYRLWGIDAAVLAGFGAFLGHLFPVWLKFRGGKGIATYVGVLLGLLPLGVVVFAIAWLVTAAITRYSSLAALVAVVVVPVALFLLGHIQVAELFTVMSLITYIKHRANIARLLSGTESRIGQKG